MRAPAPRHRWPRFAIALVVTAALADTGHTAPTLGFMETFPGSSLQGWGGGAVVTNPGTGGFGGAGDGYLHISTPNGLQHNLGASSQGPEYVGNWTVTGITQVRLRLNDVGADDPLEMHFAIGNFSNFWQYDAAFLPPHGAWAEFVVDLTGPAGWTHIIGTGTFAEALQSVSVVLVRHDMPPFTQFPDPLDGDVGLDNILLTDGRVGVPPGGRVVPRALELAAPSPNPSRGDVALSLEVFEAGPVRIEILDAGGRLVRRAELAAVEPGALHWTWNGLDAAGRRAPPGHYLVRAIGAAGGKSRGLVRVE